MSDKLTQTATDVPAAAPLRIDPGSGARILARSFYKELRASGYTPRQLLALSTELIDLITQDLQAEREQNRVKGAA